MRKPVVFIGSSSEGESIAYAIQENLEKDCDIYVWTQDVFDLGRSYLESLEKELDKVDFAILVLTEDDITISRENETGSPRDNVLFELGLFMGKLGRNRSFFVYDKNKNIKIPSDLSGISGAAYSLQQSGNLQASLGAACNKIRTAINSTGIAEKIDAMQMALYNQRLNFCKNISGYWWEKVTSKNNSLLSITCMEYDQDTLMMKIDGRTYDENGILIAYWESGSGGILFKEKKLLYHWTGWFPAKPSEPFKGQGEIQFDNAAGPHSEGVGFFSNINITDIKSIEDNAAKLVRCSAAEEQLIRLNNREKIKELVIARFSEI